MLGQHSVTRSPQLWTSTTEGSSHQCWEQQGIPFYRKACGDNVDHLHSYLDPANWYIASVYLIYDVIIFNVHIKFDKLMFLSLNPFAAFLNWYLKCESWLYININTILNICRQFQEGKGNFAQCSHCPMSIDCRLTKKNGAVMFIIVIFYSFSFYVNAYHRISLFGQLIALY